MYWLIKGELHPNQNWACFVCYLKINNIFLKNLQVFWNKLPEKLKMAFKFQKPHGSWVINQNLQNVILVTNSKPRSAYLNLNIIFDFLRQLICFRMLISFYNTLDNVNNFVIVHKTYLILVCGDFGSVIAFPKVSTGCMNFKLTSSFSVFTGWQMFYSTNLPYSYHLMNIPNHQMYGQLNLTFQKNADFIIFITNRHLCSISLVG